MRIKLTDGAEGARLPSWRPPQVAQLTAEAKQVVTVVLSEQTRALNATLTRGLSDITNLRLVDVLTHEDRLLIAWASELARSEGIDPEEVSKLTAELARYRAQVAEPVLAPARGDTLVLSLPRLPAREEAQARAILFGLATTQSTLDAGFVQSMLDPDLRTDRAVSLTLLQRMVAALPPGASESLATLDAVFARRDARVTLSQVLERLALPGSALVEPTPEQVELGSVILRERAGWVTPQSPWQLLTTTTRNDRALLGLLYASQEARAGDLRLVDDVARALVALRSVASRQVGSQEAPRASVVVGPRAGAAQEATRAGSGTQAGSTPRGGNAAASHADAAGAGDIEAERHHARPGARGAAREAAGRDGLRAAGRDTGRDGLRAEGRDAERDGPRAAGRDAARADAAGAAGGDAARAAEREWREGSRAADRDAVRDGAREAGRDGWGATGSEAARGGSHAMSGEAMRNAAREAGREAARIAGREGSRATGGEAVRDAAPVAVRDAASEAGRGVARLAGREAARDADGGGVQVVAGDAARVAGREATLAASPRAPGASELSRPSNLPIADEASSYTAERAFGSAIHLAAKAAVAYRSVAPPRPNSVPPPPATAQLAGPPSLRPDAPPSAAAFNLAQALGLSALVADAQTQALRARRRRFVRRREGDDAIQDLAAASATSEETEHDPSHAARRQARWRRLVRRRLGRP